MIACNAAHHSAPARRWRRAALALIAALPAACVAPRAANPFAGAWATPERGQIAFRDETVAFRPSGQPETPLSAASCDGRFRFTYGRQARDALLGLTARQPALRRQLESQLVRPDYQVAELACGEGGTTYVLLDDRNLLAIHRDQDIGGLERLTRL